MKVFGTTGTSNFPSLIKELDRIGGKPEYDITCQIADIDYEPNNGEFFRFSNKISTYFSEFDFFVCHAGTGTIYTLLELRKKIIVVPNPEFKDNHQRDICHFIEKNNYGIVAWKVSEIEKLLPKLSSQKFNVYNNDNSRLGFEIAQIILNHE